MTSTNAGSLRVWSSSPRDERIRELEGQSRIDEQVILGLSDDLHDALADANSAVATLNAFAKVAWLSSGLVIGVVAAQWFLS